MTKNSTSALLLKFYNAITNFGAEYVMGELDRMNENCENGIEKELVNYIITSCCKKYEVEVDSIKAGYIRNENVLCARNMSIILMKKHIHSYSNEKIAKVLKKADHSTVFRALSQYEKMGDKVKHEREFRQTYTELNDQVSKFKKDLNTVNN